MRFRKNTNKSDISIFSTIFEVFDVIIYIKLDSLFT